MQLYICRILGQNGAKWRSSSNSKPTTSSCLYFHSTTIAQNPADISITSLFTEMLSWKRATLQSIRGLRLPGSKGPSPRNGYDQEEYVARYRTHSSSSNVPKLSPEAIDDPITPHCEDIDDEWSDSIISSDSRGTIISADTENNPIMNAFAYPDYDPLDTSIHGPVLKDGRFMDLMTKNISTPILVTTTNTEVHLDTALRPRTTSPIPGLKKMHRATGNGQLYISSGSPLTIPTALAISDLSERNKEIGILSFVAFLDKVSSSYSSLIIHNILMRGLSPTV